MQNGISPIHPCNSLGDCSDATVVAGRTEHEYLECATFSMDGGGIEGYYMPIEFDRSLCCDLNETSTREWLITNGVGGYAAGTVAGMLTRMEHGLLVSAPFDTHTATPQLLLAKMDEEV